jgi:hypothetical protein
MKLITDLPSGRCLRNVLAFICAAVTTAHAQPIKWGLTLTNLNNPSVNVVVTNGDGSVSITTGGGDTYGKPDSFAYAYQQVTGDFDIRVQVVNVDGANGQDSAKGSLMVRASLDPNSYDFMINALPLTFGRFGQIESIGRMNINTDTDDLPGRNLNYGGNSGAGLYGGDTTDTNYCTYPNCWLRIVRQGDLLMSYFATTNTEDIPSASNPGSTNGWQLLCVAPTTTDFGKTVYVGLSTVAHNNDPTDTTDVSTSTYANYGVTPLYNGSASIPTTNGVPVPASMAPGAFPTKVTAVNWDVSIPADGNGYPGNIQQSNQSAPSQIIWDTGGYASVSRDILASITAESPLGFAAARYQCSGFDYCINPHDPIQATNNLGPFSNPSRDRYSSGDSTVPACQAWCPSPNYGFAFATIHKNGAAWNDQSGSFWGGVYIQLDGVSSSVSYDMIGGQLRGGQAYTRTIKLVTSDALTNGAGSSGAIERAAIAHSLAYFPYVEGWKAGYIDDVNFSGNFSDPGIPMWKHGNGWGLESGTALDGCTNGVNQSTYNSPQEIVNWVNASNAVFDGLAFVSFPGVNSQTDGMLFTVGDDEANSLRGPSANNAASPDGTGWYVAVRDIQTSVGNPTVYAENNGSDAGTSFSFLYIPWTANNLIAGHINGTNGATIKGAGSYTLTRTSVGHYQLSIPGKTDADGMLMLLNSGYLRPQPAGFSNVVDNSFLSYEYGGTNNPNNVFMINAVSINADDSDVSFTDADFNFVWVDFNNPLSLSSVAPTRPTLSIAQSGGSVVLSWTGTGFALQSATSLNPGASWTTIGTANPSAPIAISGSAMYFRLISQ